MKKEKLQPTTVLNKTRREKKKNLYYGQWKEKTREN